jgi:glutamate carboxypeptidase
MKTAATLVLALSVSVLFIGGHARAAAGALTATERALVRRIDGNYPEQLALLERIVNQNSETMNFDGVVAVGVPFLDGLKALGFETQWQDLRATANRAGHVIAVRRGHIGKRLLLIGHLDTVHPKTSPFNRFVRDGDRARGPGTDDMKNGDVVILYALKALNAGGLLRDRNITVILTGDEEMTAEDTSLTRGAMIGAAQACDAVLSFESGEPGVIVTSRRGYTSWRLEVTGRQAHSGTIFTPAVGAGAIFETARILSGFYEQVRGDPKLTFNAGTIVGGTDAAFDSNSNSGTLFGKENVVPKTAITVGEIRAVSAVRRWSRSSPRICRERVRRSAFAMGSRRWKRSPEISRCSVSTATSASRWVRVLCSRTIR